LKHQISESVLKDLKHYPWLDWVRFLAALMVLVVHAQSTFIGIYGELPSNQKTLPVALFFALTRHGNEAVLIFFVLSGYLVAGKVVSRIWKMEFRTADYAIDRFSRIYLPYIPALVLSFFSAAVVGLQPKIADFLCNALSLQGIFGESFPGNGALWSISYEVWFYILAGSAGAFFQFKDQRFFATMIAAIALFVSLAVFTVLTSTFLFCWLVGGMAYFYRRWNKSIMALALGLAIFALLALQIANGSKSLDVSRWAKFLPSAAVCQLLFATSIAALLTQLVQCIPKSPFAKRLEKSGTFWANFSYTLYVTHCPVLALIEYWFLRKRAEISFASIGSMLAGMVVCLLTAFLMYLCFERNTARFRRFLRDRLKPKTNVGEPMPSNALPSDQRQPEAV
jgi:peptidoglycan/LPS O-acetylase OafA/YrhL